MDGTLYRYNPVTDVFTTLVNFGTSGISGWSPVAGITFGNDGSLYGTTLSGGDGSVSNGGGILYRLSSSSIAAPEPSSMMLLIFGGLSVVGKRVQRHRRRY